MSYLKILVSFAVAGAAVLFSGCASNPSKADAMRDHRSNVQFQAQAESELQEQLAQDWDRGQKLIASGQKNINDGERRIDSAEKNLQRGREQLELGNREFAEGTDLVRNSEWRFREAFGRDLKLGGNF